MTSLGPTTDEDGSDIGTRVQESDLETGNTEQVFLAGTGTRIELRAGRETQEGMRAVTELETEPDEGPGVVESKATESETTESKTMELDGLPEITKPDEESKTTELDKEPEIERESEQGSGRGTDEAEQELGREV